VKSVICPTVTALSTTEYRQQLQKIQGFADRIHIDFMDGVFAPTKSIDINDAWWQPGPVVDLHVMYQKPLDYLEDLVALKPHMIIIQAEAESVAEFFKELDGLGIKKGLALLQETRVEDIEDLVPKLDHVLIFSGSLGKFGGKVDVNLLHKAQLLKKLKPSIEIGWDGGINDENAVMLAAGGVDVLNVGGYIQNAADPEGAYDKMLLVLEGDK
jgi:pentose-5-phosphate-3-epimerase